MRASPLVLPVCSLCLSLTSRGLLSLCLELAPLRGPPFPCAPRPRGLSVLLPQPSCRAFRPSLRGPGSSRFSCCLFSPFAGCVYWFISGGWYCFHGNRHGLRKEQPWRLQGCSCLSAPRMAVEHQPRGPPCLAPELGMWPLRPSLRCQEHHGGRRTPLQLHPAVCPAGPRGDHPQRCGPGLRGTCAARVAHWAFSGTVCSTGQAPAGCSHAPTTRRSWPQTPPACSAGCGEPPSHSLASAAGRLHKGALTQGESSGLF